MGVTLPVVLQRRVGQLAVKKDNRLFTADRAMGRKEGRKDGGNEVRRECVEGAGGGKGRK